jgi:hypothetical protein
LKTTKESELHEKRALGHEFSSNKEQKNNLIRRHSRFLHRFGSVACGLALVSKQNGEAGWGKEIDF